MEKRYVLEITYPDSHIEELEQSFKSPKDAVDYGVGLLNQVLYTERTKRSGADDEFAVHVKPYFIIKEVSEEGRKIVFDSRGKK